MKVVTKGQVNPVIASVTAIEEEVEAAPAAAAPAADAKAAKGKKK